MAKCKTAVSPLLTHWRYCSLALSHRYITCFLTLLLLRSEYSGKTRLIPQLLMPWTLAPPGHQQPRYWLCKINETLSYSTRKISATCAISVLKSYRKSTHIFMFTKIHLVAQGLINSVHCTHWFLFREHKVKNHVNPLHAEFLFRYFNFFSNFRPYFHTEMTDG